MNELRSWRKFYPSTISSELENDYETLLSAWQAQVAHRGDAPAVHYFDATLSFVEIDRASNSLACGLLDNGLGRGDRVAVYLQNDPQWLVALLATWKAGGIPVAMNPMLRGEDLRRQLADSGARVLVCLEDLYEAAQEVLEKTAVQHRITTHALDLTPEAKVPGGMAKYIPERRTFPGATPWRGLLDKYSDCEPPPVSVGPDDIGMLTYTSGTTGRAKGAINLQSAMAYTSTIYTKWWDLQADQDVIICLAPVFHITGSIAGFGVHLVSGAPLVMMHRFDPATTLRAIEYRGGTFMVGASTAYIALANHPNLNRAGVATLTKTLSGGAPVSQALLERIGDQTGWQLRGAYGMTETNSPTHLGPTNREAPVDRDSGALAVGVPVPGVAYRIVDPETGRDLPPGEPGEILVRGPMVIPGYWQHPEETAHAIRNGWLHTGDIGKATEDGWLFVVDRLKDIINAGGFKIYPRDVEDVLYAHPAVRETAVVGASDEYRGETVKAYVSLVPGQTVTPEELISFCKERMSAYKYPRAVEIIQDLPKNVSGKLLRRDLRKHASPPETAQGRTNNE